MDENRMKSEILKMLSLKKSKWSELKKKNNDCVNENFVFDVLLVLDWVIRDIENIV